MIRLLILLCFLCGAHNVMAQLEARILAHSLSKQTIVLNLTRFEELKEGEFLILTKEINHSKEGMRVVPVAKGRVVRVGANQTIAILFKIFDPELIVKDQPFLVFSETQSLKGRAALKLNRLEVIAEERELSKDLKELLDQDQLSYKKDNLYKPAQELHERKSLNQDSEIVDLGVWDSKKDRKVIKSIFKSENKEIISRQLQLKEFESVVTAYLHRVNQPGFSYETFYPDRSLKISSSGNEYDRYIDEQQRQKSADIRLLKKILERGDTWSEDHSDEELAQMLKDTSVVREYERKKEALSLRRNWMSVLSYQNLVGDQQTSSDQSHKLSRLYDLSVNIEWSPFERKLLEKFAFDLGLSFQRNAFAQNSFNAQTSDKSLTFGLNYYFHHYIYTLEEIIFSAGAFVRSGDSFIEIPASGDKSNYSIVAAPGFKFDLKYIFRNQIGIGLRYTYESVLYDKYSSNSFTSPLPDKKYINLSKVGLLLTTIF